MEGAARCRVVVLVEAVGQLVFPMHGMWKRVEVLSTDQTFYPPSDSEEEPSYFIYFFVKETSTKCKTLLLPVWM